MLCTQPFVRDPSGKIFKTFNSDEFYKGIPFPCGHCLACRIQRRRQWTLRLILESMCYNPDDVRFVTLTYNDESLVYDQFYNPVLCKHDIVTYIKRLRYYIPSLRYFVGGEYGSQSNRPHYHIILFGVSPHADTYVTGLWNGPKTNLGYVYIGDTTSIDALSYVAGYVSKKVGFPNHRPKSFREFSLQSRKPPLGFRVLDTIKSQIERVKKDGFSLPSSLTINGRVLPFDRTIRTALYHYFYRDMDSASDLRTWQTIKTWFSLSDADVNDYGYGRLANHYIYESKQRNLQIKAKQRIFSQGSL